MFWMPKKPVALVHDDKIVWYGTLCCGNLRSPVFYRVVDGDPTQTKLAYRGHLWYGDEGAWAKHWLLDCLNDEELEALAEELEDA